MTGRSLAKPIMRKVELSMRSSVRYAASGSARDKDFKHDNGGRRDLFPGPGAFRRR